MAWNINKDSELFVGYNTIIRTIGKQDYEQLLRYCMLKNIIVGVGEKNNENMIFHPRGYLLDKSEGKIKVFTLDDGRFHEETAPNVLEYCNLGFDGFKAFINYTHDPNTTYVIKYT